MAKTKGLSAVCALPKTHVVKLSPDKKLAGILCRVFSIRTDNDLGIGDTEGVRQMID